MVGNISNKNSYLRLVAHVFTILFVVAIPLSNSLTTIISLLVALSCVLYMERSNFKQIIKNPITIAVLIFIGINLIGVSYSMADKTEIYQALRKYTRTLYIPLLIPLFYEARWRHVAVLTFIAAVFVSVVVAINAGIVVFKDSIFTSLFVAFTVYLLAHYAIDFKRYRFAIIPLALFFVYYLFFINIGRIGQAIFIMLFVLFAWQCVRHTFKAQLLTFAVLFLILAGAVILPSSFMMRQNVAMREVEQFLQHDTIPHESSIGTRMLLAQNSWQLIKYKPLFGFGTGGFRAAYAAYAPELPGKEPRTNPHNQYLLTWVELGAVGLISLLYFFFTLVRSFWQQHNTAGYLGLGLSLSLIVGCVLNSWLLDFTSSFFFVFFIAVFAAGIPPQK